MRDYNFGIIGCGMISAFHAACIRDLPNANIVAAADAVESSAQTFAEKHSCAAHADYHEMVQRDDLDIVTICTPSGAHLDPALAAIKAGKNVIIEKPLEVTLERCDAIIQAADEHTVMLAGILPCRFLPSARAIKKAIGEGRFGRLTVGDAYNKWFRSQEYYDSGGWRGTWELDGGGAIMNQGIHAVDLVQWLMGEVDTVYALADCLARERIEVEDTAVAAIRYKSGAMGVIECTTSIYPGSTRKIAVHGEKGTVVMEDEDIVSWEFDEERPEDAAIQDTIKKTTGKEGGFADPSNIDHSQFLKEYKLILEALNNGTAPPIDGREARKPVEFIVAMYQSAKTGRPVKLPL